MTANNENRKIVYQNCLKSKPKSVKYIKKAINNESSIKQVCITQSINCHQKPEQIKYFKLNLKKDSIRTQWTHQGCVCVCARA